MNIYREKGHYKLSPTTITGYRRYIAGITEKQILEPLSCFSNNATLILFFSQEVLMEIEKYPFIWTFGDFCVRAKLKLLYHVRFFNLQQIQESSSKIIP